MKRCPLPWICNCVRGGSALLSLALVEVEVVGFFTMEQCLEVRQILELLYLV